MASRPTRNEAIALYEEISNWAAGKPKLKQRHAGRHPEHNAPGGLVDRRLHHEMRWNDVNIAEAAFERTGRMDRSCAGRIEDQINCFDRTLHAVNRREPERRTLLDRNFSARCNHLS